MINRETVEAYVLAGVGLVIGIGRMALRELMPEPKPEPKLQEASITYYPERTSPEAEQMPSVQGAD